MIRDIMPKSSTDKLKRDFGEEELQAKFNPELVSAVLGMSRAFMVRALNRPGTRPKLITLAEVMELLDVDGFQETFIPRSRIPKYLLEHSTTAPKSVPALRRSSRQIGDARLEVGDARDLISGLDPGSVQCVVTSTPYWGMRLYDNDRDIQWADGENCPYGFEQTPEGFIRHTVELLLLLKPAIAPKGSVWWNITDAHNTRTPVRVNTRERLNAMGEASGARKGWTEHDACRHSSGHRYLDDTELTSIPPRIAERASRVGYHFKSFITWRKHSVMPDSAKSRVSRQAEYVLHLSVDRTPFFDKKAWRELEERLGGPNERFESAERITDVWSLPVSAGLNGHGAEFPLALAGRCISLTSKKGDLVLDPFVGGGTTAVAAMEMERRCLGFDISERYINIAVKRLTADSERSFAADSPDIESPSVNAS
jgi:DNA modification methylase